MVQFLTALQSDYHSNNICLPESSNRAWELAQAHMTVHPWKFTSLELAEI